MNPEELLDIAYRFAMTRGFEVGHEFASLFVDQLRFQNFSADSEPEKDQARGATENFVGTAIEISDSPVLSGRTFRETISRLCPMWPFCR